MSSCIKFAIVSCLCILKVQRVLASRVFGSKQACENARARASSLDRAVTLRLSFNLELLDEVFLIERERGSIQANSKSIRALPSLNVAKD